MLSRVKARLIQSLLPLALALAPCLAPAAEPPSAPAGIAADLDLARRLNDAFVFVADSVSASVVVISVRPKAGSEEETDTSGVLELLPEELRKKLREEIERERRSPRRRLPDGFFPEQGSGVIIRADGYILTNGHVVENAEKVEVQLKDGRRFPAEVKGVDSESDIAVLKVDAKDLPPARLGDSNKVRVGEFAIAIGAPYRLAYSVTCGHISAKGRRLADDMVMMDQDFIQTDASINPGNSGGPLVNIEGQVIGINSMIRGINTGLGFAVPINLAREVCDQLIDKGRFTRAWLGVNIESVADRPEADASSLPVREGVIVTRILRDGPSWGSDLSAMDIIVSVDGESVHDVADLKRQVSRKALGKPIALEVFRGEKKLSIHVTPGELPADRLSVARRSRQEAPRPEAEPNALGGLGMKIRDLDAETAARVGLEENEGVVVSEVDGDGPARRRIRVGDVISKINRKPVRSAREFATLAREADLKKGVPVTIVEDGGKRRYEVLKQSTE